MFPRLCSRSFTFRPVYYTSKFRHFISQIESPPLCRQCTTFLLFYPSSFIYWNCNSSMSAGIALTRGADFAVFRFPRVTCSTYYRKICHAGRPKVPTPCKTSGRLGHIWGFFYPKNTKKSPVLQTYSLRRGKSLIRYSWNLQISCGRRVYESIWNLERFGT